MDIEQSLLEALRTLPIHKKQELLDHAKRLSLEASARGPRRSIEGLWADQGISISEEDIDELRREMWKNFPRDDF